MSLKVEKCHQQLTVTKKRKRIPTSYTLHNRTLERVASAKYLRVLTENLHWRKHIQSTATKTNKVSAFAHRNLKGSPSVVQAHCYEGLVHSVLEYAYVVWNSHQQHLNPH